MECSVCVFGAFGSRVLGSHFVGRDGENRGKIEKIQINSKRDIKIQEMISWCWKHCGE